MRCEHWSEVSVCVLASVFIVTDLFSLVNFLSVSVSEIVERKRFSFSKKRDAGDSLHKKRKPAWRRHPSSRHPRERQ